MRKKKTSVKETCDRLFSYIIRFSEYDPNTGMGKCITCDKWIPIKEAQNGHFVPRSHTETRYYRNNCHFQCAGCNYADDKGLYAQKIIDKYGIEYFNELNSRRHTIKHLTYTDYVIMREQFKIELEKMGINWRDPYGRKDTI